jgi:hypothetical protein
VWQVFSGIAAELAVAAWAAVNSIGMLWWV